MSTRGSSRPYVAFVAFCAVLLSLFFASSCGARTGQGSSTPATAAPAPALPRPTAIELPTIGAQSSLVVTGTNADGSVNVPPVEQPLQAGYWGGAPAPGEAGPALVLGHINGPDAAGKPGGIKGVFAKLPQLKDGDEVLIHRDDGSTMHFVVYDRIQVAKTALPWDKVLATVPGPELRLVTCTGKLDGHSFTDNLVVYARLA